MKRNHLVILLLPAFFILLLSLFFPSGLFSQTGKFGNAHVGLVYPVSTNGVHAAEYTNSFSLHLISGVSENETAFALYGLTGIIKRNAGGVQIAGVSNHIQNRAQGVQVAGVLNQVKDRASGIQIAGLTNLTGSFDGMQIAGFANISKESERGVQLSGFFNKAGDVDMQVAGLINKARKVKGVQIAGFINIADSSDYPIGLVNIIKNGEPTIGGSIDETLTTMTTFRSGGRVLYGILGLGYNFKESKSLYGLEAGMGVHLFASENFGLNLEGATLTLADFKKGEYFRSSLRLFPALKIGDRIGLFGGPTFNFITYSNDKGKDLVNHYIWNETRRDHFHGMYFGVSGGVAVRL